MAQTTATWQRRSRFWRSVGREGKEISVVTGGQEFLVVPSTVPAAIPAIYNLIWSSTVNDFGPNLHM
jgi:hypothetical protein